MKPIYFSLLCVLFYLLLFPSGLCFADINRQTGTLCSESDNSLNEDDGFLVNLRTTMDSLSDNVINRHGFYKTRVGSKKSNTVYGSVLCRGDISADNCSNCVLNSIKAASDDCPKSRDVSVWFRWCFLRYANQSFFGTMEETSVAVTNDTDFDEAKVVSEGLEFMGGVAESASEKSIMFETGVLDVNNVTKRYGMAQCTRDIRKEDCRRCLQAQLQNFRTGIGNKRRWEIYGVNCFMWYNDYRFYNNASILLSGAKRQSPWKRYTIGIWVGVLAMLQMVM
ncbi:putative cysteine-rich receptor-like protein kinase 9 [Neltuma alba]|uniref:putative cysteine-rich receptor-like protein kinase 9 n=1 Tax=Neltuma alba TaxID=207710 RepID=UPI0010A5602E|nr:putative cysteine-rich receptor-like protein kinase 9 [Prosopis alba]XP_028805328.1 putative cysteine-rich receptor-like protein kinase 9 [Prosopis alba]